MQVFFSADVGPVKTKVGREGGRVTGRPAGRRAGREKRQVGGSHEPRD